MVKVVYKTNDGKEFSDPDVAAAHEKKEFPARKISFQGHSDDVIVIGIDKGNTGFSDEIYLGEDITIKTPDGKAMRITPVYDGCWTFAIGMHDEDPFPEFKITHEVEHEYSLKVSIEVWEGSVVVVTPEDEEMVRSY